MKLLEDKTIFPNSKVGKIKLNYNWLVLDYLFLYKNYLVILNNISSYVNKKVSFYYTVVNNEQNIESIVKKLDVNNNNFVYYFCKPQNRLYFFGVINLSGVTLKLISAAECFANKYLLYIPIILFTKYYFCLNELRIINISPGPEFFKFFDKYEIKINGSKNNSKIVNYKLFKYNLQVFINRNDEDIFIFPNISSYECKQLKDKNEIYSEFLVSKPIEHLNKDNLLCPIPTYKADIKMTNISNNNTILGKFFGVDSETIPYLIFSDDEEKAVNSRFYVLHEFFYKLKTMFELFGIKYNIVTDDFNKIRSVELGGFKKIYPKLKNFYKINVNKNKRYKNSLFNLNLFDTFSFYDRREKKSDDINFRYAIEDIISSIVVNKPNFIDSNYVIENSSVANIILMDQFPNSDLDSKTSQYDIGIKNIYNTILNHFICDLNRDNKLKDVQEKENLINLMVEKLLMECSSQLVSILGNYDEILNGFFVDILKNEFCGTKIIASPTRNDLQIVDKDLFLMNFKKDGTFSYNLLKLDNIDSCLQQNFHISYNDLIQLLNLASFYNNQFTIDGYSKFSSNEEKVMHRLKTGYFFIIEFNSNIYLLNVGDPKILLLLNESDYNSLYVNTKGTPEFKDILKTRSQIYGSHFLIPSILTSHYIQKLNKKYYPFDSIYFHLGSYQPLNSNIKNRLTSAFIITKLNNNGVINKDEYDQILKYCVYFTLPNTSRFNNYAGKFFPILFVNNLPEVRFSVYKKKLDERQKKNKK